MTTDNEKLCMAIINNSVITSIDWPGVGEALGLKVNSAQKRWRRFKETTMAEKSTSSNGGKPTKATNGSKKRVITEVSEAEGEGVRRLPARKTRGKKAKTQTPSSDEEGIGAVDKEEDKDVFEKTADSREEV
jgi:hypothetical protein